MKNLFHTLFAFAILSLALSCNNDDDDNGGGNGTGGGVDDLEVVLTWDAVGPDLDLSMAAPNGGVLGGGFVFNSSGVSSGDDLEGPGEESITFDNNAPDGTYVITVDIIDENVAVDFTLKVSSEADSRTFNETIIDDPNTADESAFIITVTKDGRNLTF